MDRKRQADGTGRFAGRGDREGAALRATPEIPASMQQRPGESLDAWLERIKTPFLQEQLRRGLTDDLVGIKRHELFAKHAYAVKSELDVTARQADAWIQALTDDELDALDRMRRAALTRGSGKEPSQAPVTVHQQALPEHVGYQGYQADQGSGEPDALARR